MGVPLSGSVTTTDEGSPQLPASRCRPGPVVMLLAQPDILLKCVFRELDGALAHGDIRHRQVSKVRVSVARGDFVFAITAVAITLMGSIGRWEDGEQVGDGNASDVFLGEGEEDARATEGRVWDDFKVFLAF